MRIGLMLRALDEKGGIGVYTRGLVEALLEHGAQHEYVLFYRSAANRRYARPRVTERLVRAPSKALWDQVAIPAASAREKIDVLLHPKFTVPLLSPVPAVMVLHGADWFLPEAAHFYPPLDRAYIRAFMPLYLRRAAAVLSVSQLTTQHFERIFRLPPGRITTTYFAPAPQFRRVTERAVLDEVRARYGLPERFVLTLSKAHGGARKNMAGILEAWRRLGDGHTRLVVAGKGLDRFRTDYRIPQGGWGETIHFPGWIDQRDLPAVYTLADLFLYPSNQEAFPIPLTEAMACGTPIVTSDANGPREIAGDAALRVDPADPAAIADAVLRVLHDGELRARLVAAGRVRSGHFSWETCAHQTIDVLERVARTGGRG